MNLLATYGYTGGTVADLQAYRAAGAWIADVRYSPRSRVVQWRGEELANVLGARYVQLGFLLGNRNYRSGGPIQIVDLENGLPILRDLLKARPVVLLCACEHAAGCHRKVIADAAVARWPELVVRHLKPGERL